MFKCGRVAAPFHIEMCNKRWRLGSPTALSPMHSNYVYVQNHEERLQFETASPEDYDNHDDTTHDSDEAETARQATMCLLSPQTKHITETIRTESVTRVSEESRLEKRTEVYSLCTRMAQQLISHQLDTMSPDLVMEVWKNFVEQSGRNIAAAVNKGRKRRSDADLNITNGKIARSHFRKKKVVRRGPKVVRVGSD